MPYKDGKRYRDYMREYMKRQRSFQAQTKRQMQADVKSMENLRKNFPTAYELLFGKQKRKTK
jgi:hypothetical protein